MQNLVLSQSAVYQLQQLTKTVRDKTGVRHRLSDQKSILSLLRYSSSSPDPDIYTYFNRFTNELDEDQRDHLMELGLIIPTVLLDKVDTSHFFINDQQRAV